MVDIYQANVAVLLFTESGSIKDALGNSAPANTANTYVSSTQAKYGTSSIFTSAYGASIGAATLNNLGSADFTIEAWAFQQTTGDTSPTLFRYNGESGTANGRVQLTLGAADCNLYVADASGAWDLTIPVAGGRPSLDTWHHWAVTRSGNLNGRDLRRSG